MNVFLLNSIDSVVILAGLIIGEVAFSLFKGLWVFGTYSWSYLSSAAFSSTLDSS